MSLVVGDARTQAYNKHMLQDYQMQLMLVEQQNRKRLLLAKQLATEQGPVDATGASKVAGREQMSRDTAPDSKSRKDDYNVKRERPTSMTEWEDYLPPARKSKREAGPLVTTKRFGAFGRAGSIRKDSYSTPKSEPELVGHYVAEAANAREGPLRSHNAGNTVSPATSHGGTHTPDNEQEVKSRSLIPDTLDNFDFDAFLSEGDAFLEEGFAKDGYRSLPDYAIRHINGVDELLAKWTTLRP